VKGARDVKAAFERCSGHIAKLLQVCCPTIHARMAANDSLTQEYPGRLHFATDAWTSPNHCAFVAWTVHLEHQGQMLGFLLDIVEVPESHTGATLAREFHNMLLCFGLENKVQSPCQTLMHFS
jgi:hypothetical protein